MRVPPLSGVHCGPRRPLSGRCHEIPPPPPPSICTDAIHDCTIGGVPEWALANHHRHPCSPVITLRALYRFQQRHPEPGSPSARYRQAHSLKGGYQKADKAKGDTSVNDMLYTLPEQQTLVAYGESKLVCEAVQLVGCARGACAPASGRVCGERDGGEGRCGGTCESGGAAQFDEHMWFHTSQR